MKLEQEIAQFSLLEESILALEALEDTSSVRPLKELCLLIQSRLARLGLARLEGSGDLWQVCLLQPIGGRSQLGSIPAQAARRLLTPMELARSRKIA